MILSRGIFGLLVIVSAGGNSARPQPSAPRPGGILTPQQLIVPAADEVLAKLQTVNNRFLLNWPDPAANIVTDRARPSNIWTRATYFEGLMALHKISPDPRYLNYAQRWAESHGWNLAYGSAVDRVADDQCCGQTYLDLYALDPQPNRIANIKTAIDAMVNSAKSDDWWWIDALQMAMPVFARLGAQTGDSRYFEKMYALYSHTRSVEGGRGLYNPAEHLWWRDADFDPPYQEPNGANCYWSRGNGWVFAALVRVLEVLPATEPHRAEYMQTFRDMAAALLPLQRLDGFWNVSLMDPGNYGGRELTGTAFFTYGMAWGIRKGYLPRSTYLPVVTKAWSALANLAVRPDGTLGYVQGSGKQPSDGQPVTYDSSPNFDDFGTGAFLLAGTEVYQLASIPMVDYVGFWREGRIIISPNARYPNASQSIATFPSFILLEVRGTALDRAFSTPPRLLLPDGVTSIQLSNTSPTEWHYEAAGLQAGHYALVLGNAVVHDLALSDVAIPACIPQGPGRSVDRASAVTFVYVPSGTPRSAETLFRLIVTRGLPPIESYVQTSADRLSLTLPPYLLTNGIYEYSITTLSRTTALQDVNLGTAAAHATLEVGCRFLEEGYWLGVHEPSHAIEKLVNVSTRGFVPVGGDLTAGFVISPGGPKMVLVRAVGPGLQNFGVSNALPNPYLRVYNSNRTRAWQNDDWQSTPQYLALDRNGATTLVASYANPRDAALAAREAGAFPLTSRSRDAALVLVLPPGNYTAQATSAGAAVSGTALVEVYELTPTPTDSRLTNVSSRGVVSPSETLTVGFVISGGTKRVLLRAIGPTLAGYGVPAAATLPNPRVTLFNSKGEAILENDDWGSTTDLSFQTAFRVALGAFPLPAGSRDSEIATTLEPGAYVLRVSSADSSTGAALAEVYAEPPGS